jgi:hypothetical protein
MMWHATVCCCALRKCWQVATDGRWNVPLQPFCCPAQGAWAASAAASVAFASVTDSSLQGCFCVELLGWMLQPSRCNGAAQVSVQEEGGRLLCPKCGSKLGRWTWGTGSRGRCSGAVWSALCVVFALQRSRLR